jgi:phosphatidylserine/phosphatidylglycerophosphate/cardiolipin synthase-like enzyme
MENIVVIGRNWRQELAALASAAFDDLLISSPYITAVGCDTVCANLSDAFRTAGRLTVLTDLSPMAMCQAATDPTALRSLMDIRQGASIYHLPRLHAKVYIADTRAAIVTSGNLTAGGLIENYEYGLRVCDPAVVQWIRNDLAAYASLGAAVSESQLADYSVIAREVRKTFRQTQAAISKAARQRFAAVVRKAEDELVRLRLAGGAMHTVFAKTILYLLRRYGPLPTVNLHAQIETIHPDLCDNAVDRVIDGERFGKKWKHAVRTAQQQLKKRGLVELRDERWRAVPV